MKLLKNKKFWAMSLGAITISTSIVAFAASCSNSNIKSKLSKQLVQTKDQKNYFAVYEIENYTKLTDEEKKSLENLEFGVSVLDKDGKNPVNIKVKGVHKDGNIYVKLPRKPEVNEKLLIVPTKNILKKEALVLNKDNLNYQTEEVNFENAPKPESTPTPTPTPAPKEDKAVVSKIELVEEDKQSKKAKVKLEFSEFSLKDETKKALKLTLTSESGENKEFELELSADKKSATTKEPVDFSTKTYKVSKLTLNGAEVNVDSVKNNDLEIPDPASASKVDLIEENTQLKKAKIKLTFSKEITVAQPSLKLTLIEHKILGHLETQETKVVDLVLNQDKKSATTKEPLYFAGSNYEISKLTLNGAEVNVDSVKKEILFMV